MAWSRIATPVAAAGLLVVALLGALTDLDAMGPLAGPADRSAADGRGADCAAPCLGVGLQLPSGVGPSYVDGVGAFDQFVTGTRGPEPTIGVSPDGSEVYIQASLNTLRSLNGGASWANVAPALGALTTFDPMMHYDPVIDRLHVNHLTVECTVHSWANDPGSLSNIGLTRFAEWVTNPHACGVPALDRQQLNAGPNPLALDGRALYLAYSQLGTGAHAARSLDGGLTWTPHVVMNTLARGTPAWPTGQPVPDPAGTHVYVPVHAPGSGLYIGVSHNEGLTYLTRLVDGSTGSEGVVIAPDAGVDASGNVYAVWYSKTDKQIHYTWSSNNGDTWNNPQFIVSNNVDDQADSYTLSTVFPTVAAGATGKFAVAYLGTPTSNAGPDNCDNSGVGTCIWYLYVAHVEDANTATPTITVTRVSDVNDVVQTGRICTQGLDCSGGRNLLDFIDMVATPDGKVHIVIADGCTCGPSATGQSNNAIATYFRQISGPTIS